jgi:hypothetical protein
VAHSSINDNPYYDAAKYEGYLSADEQLLLTSPLENIPGEIGFDWLINDRRSFAPANGAPAGPLELDATFLGFLANPVITVSHGQNDYVINYTSQHDVAVLPLLGSDVAVQQLQSTVIREFVTYLQRLPSPAELDRFARRLQQKGGDVGYLHQVLTYNGKYDPRNQVSIDAVHDQYYDHVAGELRYAYQGIVNLADRSTYRMLGDEFQARMDLPEPVMANIIAYAFYALAQVAHDMNVHGDLLMYLGPSQKIMTILKTGYMSITEDPATLVTAINDFNFLLRGNYAFPSPNGEPTSPLANGLNVESPSYQEMISTYLHPAFGAPPMVAEHSGHQDHMVDVHSGHHDHTMA